MSIFDRTGHSTSVTEGKVALDLFTDRLEAIHAFLDRLHATPSPTNLWFFWGDGGNGKSLLLRFLREYCCVHLTDDTHQHIKSLATGELEDYLRGLQSAPPIMVAHLDFGMPPRGEERPQEAFAGLLMLRRQLSRCGFHLPFYDFANVWYLHKTGRLTPDRLKNLFPAEGLELASSLADIALKSPWASLAVGVLKVFDVHLKEKFTLYQQKRDLDPTQVEEICRMDPETELIDALPRLFAQDLNTSLWLRNQEAKEQLVLFFDTHEAFWGNERKLSNDLFFARDEWLRCLLGHLDLEAGITVVIAGRDQPRWPESARCTIPPESINSYLVECLSDADADAYLQRLGVKDAVMRRSLLESARAGSNQIHPLYLGLSGDVVLAATKKGTPLTPADFPHAPNILEKGKVLVDRLLRYTDVEITDAVKAMSACRSFDQELYFHLAEPLKFQASQASFRILTQFQFVWQSASGGNSYRIHDLLRRLLKEIGGQTINQAHEVLEKFYRAQASAGQPAALAEALYHANRLDWQRSITDWGDSFDEALGAGRYETCRSLLDIRTDLRIESDFAKGRLAHAAGDYFGKVSRFPAAIEEYEEAIRIYDEVLRQNPNCLEAYANQGNALTGLGAVQMRLSRHENATSIYRRAITTFDALLAFSPQDAHAYGNKANSLHHLGNLLAELSRSAEAQKIYRDTIEAFDRAQALSPDNYITSNNKAIALRSVCELHRTAGRFDEAIDCCRQSITACDDALRQEPGYLYALNSKGNALTTLGELLTKEDIPTAGKSYRAAVAVSKKALALAPDFIEAYNTKAVALRCLGVLQAQRGRKRIAQLNYQRAIEVFEYILEKAPDDNYAYNNLGIALHSLGDLQEGASALSTYNRAIASIDNALRVSPNDIAARHNKGSALLLVSILHEQLGQYAEACQNLHAALTEFSRILVLAPDNTPIRETCSQIQKKIQSLCTPKD